MKHLPLKTLSCFLSLIILFASCASSTLIQTNVDGADLYLDDESVGKTPYTMRDTKIVGSTTLLRIQKEGYTTINTSISKDEKADVGAIIGGCFLLFPFLWTMKYKPVHSYELHPNSVEIKKSSEQVTLKSSELRELKKLFDEGIISKEEFEAEKQKMLDN